MRDQVNKILSSHADPGVDNLVICAPEVWTTQSAVRRGQLDGRTILRDICSRIPGVDRDRIRIVSEPAAASAYFAYQYRRAVGSNFNGCLLIVDYGGGTLDLTLTEVHPQDASVEIKVLFRTGAGEKVPRRPGRCRGAGAALCAAAGGRGLRLCDARRKAAGKAGRDRPAAGEDGIF